MKDEIVFEVAAIDGQIAVFEYVGDIAVTGRVGVASVVVVRTTVDGHSSLVTSGTDLNQTPIAVVAETELVGILRTTAEGEARITNDIEQGEVVDQRIGRCVSQLAGCVACAGIGDQCDLLTLVQGDLPSEGDTASNGDHCTLAPVDGVDQLAIVSRIRRRSHRCGRCIVVGLGDVHRWRDKARHYQSDYGQQGGDKPIPPPVILY